MIGLSEEELKRVIEQKKGSLNYSAWTIGVTDKPEIRKDQHKSDGENVNFWNHWTAATETVARNVEKHFLDRGMKGGSGGGGTADYVYMF